MARICAACRLPVDDPRSHDCPEDRDPDGPDEGSDDGEAA